MEVSPKIIQLLTEKKNELEHRLDKLKESSVQPLDKSSKEAAIELESNEVDEGLDKEAREELEQVYLALQRIDSGTYGTCRSCLEGIPMRRLEAVPFTSICMKCIEEETTAS